MVARIVLTMIYGDRLVRSHEVTTPLAEMVAQTRISPPSLDGLSWTRSGISIRARFPIARNAVDYCRRDHLVPGGWRCRNLRRGGG